MSDHPQHIARLLLLHLQGELTPAETEELQAWLALSDRNRHFFDHLSEHDMAQWMVREELDQHLHVKDQIFYRIQHGIQTPESIPVATEQEVAVRRLSARRLWWAAAIFALVLGGGAYLWYSQGRQQMLSRARVTVPVDIAPGKEGAILTLADGSKVVLDSLGNGLVAAQNGSQVALENGQLAYQPTGTASGTVTYNTMTTPKGRQFGLQLPDGSKVWLNAASAITYPTAFTGKQRQVTIAGEAYLEVAQNKAMPFHVEVAGKAGIDVLGTRFNVNAYDNEASINTTLLEGSLRVSDATVRPVVLQPGQQARIAAQQAGITVVKAVDTDKVMAWRNGAFNFDGAHLPEVMRQLERWYDIRVIYEKGIPDKEFVGEVGRNVSLAELLKGLEGTGVHFRLDGRTLVVLP